jgi:hypothetical protein
MVALQRISTVRSLVLYAHEDLSILSFAHVYLASWLIIMDAVERRCTYFVSIPFQMSASSPQHMLLRLNSDRDSDGLIESPDKPLSLSQLYTS